jgi:eukaryotic-like serine/threonine-protein kinase
MRLGPGSDASSLPGARDSDSLARLRALFDRAVEVPLALRAAWLDEAISDSDERLALQRLLAADMTAAAILDVPVADVAGALVADIPEVEGLIGQRIGAFRLTRLLGKGGMAVVFLGERDDGQFDQLVAIKLLRRGLFSEVEQKLFARERQVLAQLTHPNIARLFDGGVTQAGIPFLIIEHVDGQTIIEYANSRRLGVHDRLRLFLVVCSAVEAAHQGMVVHRDIKPANILVRDDGVVKLLDFGIAKLLDEDIAAATSSAFTPEYAAPEQLKAGPITTATDVFALGMLLHELLVGVRPDRQDQPRRPSSVAAESIARHTGQAGARELRGDLDNVLLKALATEPALRYPTATAFADDVRRYLDGRTVAAYPPSHWYRARKFVARNKGSVASALAFVVALGAALAITLWQATIARNEAHRANAVRDFVERIFDPVSKGTVEGRQPSYATLLETSVQRLDEDHGIDDNERVDLLLLFARLDEKIGEYDKAIALADRASEYSDRALGPLQAMSVQASVDGGLMALHHGFVEKAAVRLAAAEQRYQRAGIGGMALIRLYDGLSALADNRGDASGSLHYAQLSFSERAAVFPADDEKLAVGYNNLAFAFETRGDFERAADAYRHAVDIHEQQLAPSSFETAIPLSSLGSAEALAGRVRDGDRDLLRANAMFALATGKPRDAYANNLGQLCTIETEAALDGAEQHCADALRISAAIYSKDNPGYALAQLVDGRRLMALGRYAEARAQLDAAWHALDAAGTSSWRGRAKIARGELAFREDESADAIRWLVEGLQEFGRGYPPTLRAEAQALLALACSEAPAPVCPANAYRDAAADIASRSYAWSAMLLTAHVALARVEIATGDAQGASDRLRSIVTQSEAQVAATAPSLIDATLWLAIAESNAGDCKRAMDDIDRARRSIAATPLAAHPLLRAVNARLRNAQNCTLAPIGTHKESATHL